MKQNIFFDSQSLLITNAVEEDNLLRIEGTAAHFGEANLNNEIVDEKSFENFFLLYNNGKLKPALNFNHDPYALIGGIDDLFIRDNALWCSAHLNKDIAICRDTLIPMVMSGDIKSYSTEGWVGFNDIVEHDDGTYYCKNFMLTGVAVVSLPADYNSEFSIKNYFENNKTLKTKKLNPIYHIFR